VPLAVRVGVHAGEPLEDDAGDLRRAGGAVAHRLCEAAAGENLVSETARGLLTTRREHALRPVGRLLLKASGERIGAYECSGARRHAGDRAPPSERCGAARRARGRAEGRLLPPRVPDEALPREALVAQVRQGLRTRLVTVVRAPGTARAPASRKRWAARWSGCLAFL